MLYDTFHNGINLGGWLAQCSFLCTQPPTAENLHHHWMTFIRKDDFARIADMDFDHVRLPVSGFYMNDPFYIETILRSAEWCSASRLNLVLDLHDIEGNVYGAMDAPMPLLVNPTLQESMLSIWKKLAVLLKGIKKPVIMFEILNEVSDGSDGYLWRALYKKAVNVIRSVSPDRPILIGSNGQNAPSCLNELELLRDPHINYGFHYYEPLCFTHQKASFSEEMKGFGQTVHYPGDISAFRQYLAAHPAYQNKYALTANEKNNDHALMEKLLKPAFNFVKYSGHELYCGEFGVINAAPPADAARWKHDLTVLLDEYKIGHAMWNYRSLDFGMADE